LSTNFSICLLKTLLLGAGREEGHKAGRRGHGEDVVVEGGEGGEQEEGKAHHEHEEHGVVVEQRECGGRGLGHFVLLPQHSLVLLALASLLVSHLLQHISSHGHLNLLGNLVLHDELCVLVGEGHEVGAEAGHHQEHGPGGVQLQGVDAHV